MPEGENRTSSADLLSEVKRLRAASDEAIKRFEDIQKRIAEIERRLEDRQECARREKEGRDGKH